MKYIIFYHNEDNDGLFSAAILINYLVNNKEAKLEDIAQVGCTYNNLISFFSNKDEVNRIISEYDEIYMTDISINGENAMREFSEMCTYKVGRKNVNKLTWIDHHKSMIESIDKKYIKKIPGLRDTTHSAILNMWKYLYNDEPAPELFNILSAWDSFTFNENGYTKDDVYVVNKGVTSFYELNIYKVLEAVNNIIAGKNEDDIEVLANYGKILADYDDFNYKLLMNNSLDINWFVNNNQPAGALFMQGPTSSLMFEYAPEKIRHGIVFKHNTDNTWTVSVYNRNNDDTFHLGEYLRDNYGGGGHCGAAGCTLTDEQFITILKNKKI